MELIISKTIRDEIASTNLKNNNKQFFKDMVSTYYQFQKLRIQTGNRLCGHFFKKLGIKSELSHKTQVALSDLSEEDKMGKLSEITAEESLKLIGKLKEEFKRITDILVHETHYSAKKFGKLAPEVKGVFSDFSEYVLMEQYMNLLDSEEKLKKTMETALLEYPIWTEFMKKVSGCGVLMASVIIAKIEPSSAPYPASFWKYAGLDVADDGRGRRNYKEHLVDREYRTAAGEIETRKSTTYSPFLKTKLIGVLGPCLIKAGSSIYVKMYRDYKNRLENHPAHVTKSKGHRNNMAIRYMIKRFLVDLHTNWRRLEGLPITEEYKVRMLGMVHRNPELSRKVA